MGAILNGTFQCEFSGVGVIEVRCTFSCVEKSIQLNAVENPYIKMMKVH